MKKTKQELFNAFRNGAVPTQQDFQDLINTLLEIEDIATLQQDLNAHKAAFNNYVRDNQTVTPSEGGGSFDINPHKSEDTPHTYGGKFQWKYNAATQSLDLVVLP